MDWSKIVDKLRQEGDLNLAALFDLQGECLAATEDEGVSISRQEAEGVLNSLQIPSSAMYALCVGGQKVSCLRVDDSTLIGRTYTEVFVAHRTDTILICAFSALDRGGRNSCSNSSVGNSSSGSCLASVREFALQLQTQPLPVVASPRLT